MVILRRSRRRSEERPWFRLVTCLPDFSRLQIRGLREGRISENLSLLSPLSSVATREALRTELCQLGIFSRRPKKQVDLPLR